MILVTNSHKEELAHHASITTNITRNKKQERNLTRLEANNFLTETNHPSRFRNPTRRSSFKIWSDRTKSQLIADCWLSAVTEHYVYLVLTSINYKYLNYITAINQQLTTNNPQMESNLATAARELQELQQWEMEQKAAARPCTTHRRFPPSCLGLLRGIEGNLRCVDCDATNPQWATVSFGALLCITCSGNHRQLGVQVRTTKLRPQTATTT